MARLSRGSDAQQRKAIELCPRLEDLFKVIWPKANQYPTASDCLNIAYKLYVVNDTPRPKKPSSTALKYARLLLLHLPSVRSAWESSAQMHKVRVGGDEIILNQLELDNCLSVLKTIENTELGVTAFLRRCAPLQQSAPNKAAFIADAVQMTWLLAKTAPVPKAVGPNDPLCRFVTEALALVGIRRSPSTISEMLRNRYDRQRKSDRPRLKKVQG
jgi:hypothetical protein